VSGTWVRLGRLDLDASRASAWAVSHAALPIPEPVGEGRWNIYLSLRDPQGRARIGRTVLTLEPKPAFSPLEPDPILDLGERGTFDDNGIVGSCLAQVHDQRYLFYTGWNRGVTVPFYLGAGLAVSDAGGPFRRISRAPVLELVDEEPFLTASPFVCRDGTRWRMWYVSGTGWIHEASSLEPCYNIRYAESEDGINWERPGRTCIDYGPGEHAIARPWVIRDDDCYRMWFAVRGVRYRIGYAESIDGINWTRADHAGGLTPSAEGWDSDMVEYPCMLDYQGRRHMLYNGNDYGKTGVGLAVWQPASDDRRR
jgi:hypothetical protein